MIIAILANSIQKEEWLKKKIAVPVSFVWADTLKTLQMVSDASIYVDLAFNAEPERIKQLKKLLPRPILINAVNDTLQETDPSFIRINAWPGFIERDIIEICGSGTSLETIETILLEWQWKYTVVPDIPGMISARIIASIINEAYYTWGEGVSTRQEIDIAMKLGTNYPIGPFEWCQQIGKKNILALLNRLEKNDSRYAISSSLKLEGI